ncbi:MAG: DUF368 domain-containing protein [Bacteroidales bacterium]
MMKHYIYLIAKGFAMGAANVIPGVSGGTIALITGIFERLIDAIKSFNIHAAKLLFAGKFKEFSHYTQLPFIIAIFGGAILSIVSLARLLDFLFIHYPVFIWSFFFGLIMASVIFVGKTIATWNLSVVLSLIIGTTAAATISFLNPAIENDAFWYLIICGIVAVCSMILPGLSGSFVLILMGNYQLIMIDAVNNLDIGILFPVLIGCVVGLVVFSHGLSWLFKTYKDQTVAILTGFIFGSLAILWPWKKSYDIDMNLVETNSFGAFVSDNGHLIEDIKIASYKPILPEINSEFAIAIGYITLGFISIFIIEKIAQKNNKTN